MARRILYHRERSLIIPSQFASQLFRLLPIFDLFAVYGPILMVVFALCVLHSSFLPPVDHRIGAPRFSNSLLVTVLISILSDTFAKVQKNATREFVRFSKRLRQAISNLSMSVIHDSFLRKL